MITEDANEAGSSSARPESPLLSVVVPVYNSLADLKQSLRALAESDFTDFEVIVVDDSSTEPIARVAAEAGFRYLRLDSPHGGPQGPARARNLGAEQARGRYVVFIDADVRVHRDTLSRFAAAFAADSALGAVIGSYDDEPADPGFISQYKNLFHHYVHQRADGPVATFWSGCGAMRRDLFLSAGGFDERRYPRPSIEDIELGARLSRAGHRIILDRRITAQHLKRWTLRSLIATDVFDRGIPWTRLLLQSRAAGWKSRLQLNLQPSQMLSVALAYLSAAALLAAFFFPPLLILSAASAVALTLLNRDLYRFFAGRAGWRFAARIVPLHWLYLFYCGFCAVAGAIMHYLESIRSKRP